MISKAVTQSPELKERPPEVVDHEDYTPRSIGIGIACTVFFHILLLWLSPRFGMNKFSGVHSGIAVTKPNQGKSFDFELTPPEP